MSLLALRTYFLVTMGTGEAVGLLRADLTSLHDLVCRWVRDLSREVNVELKEPCERDVGGKGLDPIVRDPVLRSTLRTLYLKEYMHHIMSQVTT